MTPPLNTKGPEADRWLEAFEEIPATAEAHAAYQRAMADSHIAFLRTAEAAASRHLHATLTGQPLPRRVEQAEATPAWTVAEALPATPMPATLPLPTAPALSPVVEAVGRAPVPPDAAPALSTPTAGSAGSVSPEVVDFQELLLDIVAEKTGYPREILAMEMALEPDLGIDSIKRVEILGALKDRIPELPEVDPSQIPDLRTLGQVLELIEQRGAGGNFDAEGPARGAPAGMERADGDVGAGGNGSGRSASPSTRPAVIDRAVVREVPRASILGLFGAG